MPEGLRGGGREGTDKVIVGPEEEGVCELCARHGSEAADDGRADQRSRHSVEGCVPKDCGKAHGRGADNHHIHPPRA